MQRTLRLRCSFLLLVTAIALETFAAAGAWTTGGPDGGPIRAIVVDPNSNTVLYVGTGAPGSAAGGSFYGGGGVFKTANRGATWTAMNTGLNVLDTYSLAATRAFFFGPVVLFAGTSGGAYRSMLGGPWSQINTGLVGVNPFIHALAIDTKSLATLYAGKQDGVYVTTNGGFTWTSASTGLINLYVTALAADPNAGSALFAGTTAGTGPPAPVFFTSNGGGSWTPTICGLTTSPVDVLALQAVNAPFLHLYAGTSAGVFGRGLFPCWTQLTLPADRFRALARDPNSPQTLYAGSSTGTVYAITNAGTTWVPVNAPLPAEVDSLAVDSQGNAYAGTDGAGFFRNLGGSWVAHNRGLTGHPTVAVAVAPSQPNVVYAATSEDGIYKSVNDGATWTSVQSNLPSRFTLSIAVDPTNPDIVYAGMAPPAPSGGLYKSTNGGATWSPASAASPGLLIAVNALAIDPTNPSTLYAGTINGIFKSTNGGTTWSILNTGSPFNDALTVAIDPLVPSTVYAGGYVFGVLKSTNGGASWTQMINGLAAPNVTSLSIRPDHPDILYAATDLAGVFRSDTGGSAWSPVNAGLPNMWVKAVVIDPAQPNTVYAGSFGDGVWVSTNTGANWSSFNTGSPNRFINGLTISPSGNGIHAATGGSVYDLRSPGPP